MNYTLILGILVAAAVILMLVIVIAVIVGKVKEKKYDLENEYDDDVDDSDDLDDDEEDVEEEEYDDEEEEYEDEEPVPLAPKKKQWKVIFENLDSWERKSIIFYDNIGIGRKRESDEFEKYYVIDDDPRVSKLHCALVCNAGKLYLKDMGSRNGTYLNGKKIERPVIIQKEDIIGIGETQIEIKKVLKEK